MATDESHDARAGRFPEVSDEAPTSAPWLPWLGLGALALLIAYVLFASAAADETEASENSEAQLAAPSED